jgi:hypothetical protein
MDRGSAVQGRRLTAGYLVTLNRADHSPDNSKLWYSDPVGSQVVRNMTPGTYTITSPDGFRIWVELEDLKPALKLFRFTASRKGLIWARTKKAPEVLQDSEGNESETLTTK